MSKLYVREYRGKIHGFYKSNIFCLFNAMLLQDRSLTFELVLPKNNYDQLIKFFFVQENIKQRIFNF